MEDTIDLLKIKIEKAKESLPNETRLSIEATPWRDVIYNMRKSRRLSLTQIEDLELETELVLCGLTSPEAYPAEIQSRLKLTKIETDSLIQEINESIFKKIREDLIRRTKGRIEKPAEKVLIKQEPLNKPTIDAAKNTEPKQEDAVLIRSILSQKLSSQHTAPQIKTEYSIGNMAKKDGESAQKSNWSDPYRINPGE